MHKIKIFMGSDTKKLEAEINEWLAKNQTVKVVQITQSESSSDEAHKLIDPWGVTITVLYKP